jgi:hypothetical protein
MAYISEIQWLLDDRLFRTHEKIEQNEFHLKNLLKHFAALANEILIMRQQQDELKTRIEEVPKKIKNFDLLIDL